MHQLKANQLHLHPQSSIKNDKTANDRHLSPDRGPSREKTLLGWWVYTQSQAIQRNQDKKLPLPPPQTKFKSTKKHGPTDSALT